MKGLNIGAKILDKMSNAFRNTLLAREGAEKAGCSPTTKSVRLQTWLLQMTI